MNFVNQTETVLSANKSVVRNNLAVTLTLLVLFVFQTTEACYHPKNGFMWNHEELVKKAKTILIAELENIEKKEGSTFYVLKPIEVLKGEAPKEIRFLSHSFLDDLSNDFNDHSDEKFWKEDIGRSDWPCCICGPDHAFTFGEKYLLFPGAFGAMKSAEAIHSDEDQWLTYVKKHIKPAYSTRGGEASTRE